MLSYPPIDKLNRKAECRYKLVCGIAKRARQIQQQDPGRIEKEGKKPLTIAAEEVYTDKIKIVSE